MRLSCCTNEHLLDQVLYAAKRATANGPLGDQAKPAFHLVQPRGVGGSVVDVVARSLRRPSWPLGVLVGGIVIDDKVNLESFRDGPVQPPQEGEELLVAVMGLAFGEDRTGGDIQSCR